MVGETDEHLRVIEILSGEVANPRNLANRSIDDLVAGGMQLRLDTVAGASTPAPARSLSS